MKINTILPIKGNDIFSSQDSVRRILGTLRGFLADLLEKNIVNALLVPQEVAHGCSLAQTLVQDPANLGRANPLSPVMPVNSAILISKLSVDLRRKLGVVLKPCEMRALIELIKLQQASLENLIIIGVDCLGTYEVVDYARLIDELKEADGEKGAQVVKKLLAQLAGKGAEPLPISLRPACQICEFPTPQGADISLGVIGVDGGILITLEDDLAGKLGLVEGEALGREKAVAKLVQARSAARDRAFSKFREKVKTINDFADLFATCIGCYNCSTACPICFCNKCFFNTETFEPEAERYFMYVERKGALRMPPEILLFQLTRLNHMVASCIGCGLCESACPSKLPLTVIFRTIGDKVQKKLKYTPGRSLEDKLPLLSEFVQR